MPTAIKVISTLCIFIASIFIANILFMQKADVTFPVLGLPLFSFINMFGAGAMIIITLVTLLRLTRLVGFARVLVYTLLLALGLNVLLMLKYLVTGYGLFTILFNLAVIVFVIGVRGYLVSEHAYKYFNQ
ncbi:MAG: hypothetical protein PVG20_04175 [Thioalkalispiraceae bacterium]|jgi:hypothetical protein